VGQEQGLCQGHHQPRGPPGFRLPHESAAALLAWILFSALHELLGQAEALASTAAPCPESRSLMLRINVVGLSP